MGRDLVVAAAITCLLYLNDRHPGMRDPWRELRGECADGLGCCRGRRHLNGPAGRR